jgi:hypothetical protein
MERKTRFTILTFPQYFDGNILKLNIVFLPRNQNPLTSAIVADAIAPIVPDAPAFATANLSFTAKIINSLENFPVTTALFIPKIISTAASGDRTSLFNALATQFNIKNLGAVNNDISINADIINENGVNARTALPVEQSVQKYLPLTYRKSFNFTSPVTNAKIDDSYHCALRNKVSNPGFKQSANLISWGQVFAYIIRQPLLAEKAGMIYHAEFEVDATLLTKGGWLYIDLANDSDYKTQQNIDGNFIKNYAARIPALKNGEPRTLFAPVQFPVLPIVPPGAYDNVFIEASTYDDGFAKIVHSFQPVSQNFLQEESDGFHPTKETGIRLDWDDEQILTWYVRALAEDSSVGAGKKLDSPLGVFGYKIDVKEKGNANWDTLNFVTSKAPLSIAQQHIGDFAGELNYQVYPSQINGDIGANYWLPMYFANWAGKSMVLHDDDAADIYQNNADVKTDPLTNVTGAAQNNLNKIYSPAIINTELLYGHIYEFRVRLGDISGGPTVDEKPFYNAPSPIATTHFKRYVAPHALQIQGLVPNDDSKLFTDASIKINRPLLGYPSVVFTGKYADPVGLLKTASLNMAGKEAFGIADPDVESVEIIVEIKALQMDNLLSITGKESYIKYFTTTRKFPTASATFDDLLNISLQYVDAHVLNFGDESDLGDDFGFTKAQIDSMDALPLPTGRTIRLTLRAVCKQFDGYYGLENADPNFNTRYGKITQFLVNQPSQNEKDLLLNTSPASQIKGIYLQPDSPPVFDGNYAHFLLGKTTTSAIPDIVQRLSKELNVQNSGLTLVGEAGQRIQFGCSNRIRHTLSPDNSSLTFASKEDLIHHWLVCITLEVNRDWTWDALNDVSFIIQRKKRFQYDDVSETETEIVGSIEIKKTASINALIDADRSNTTILFIDAVEPKNTLMQKSPHQTEPRFPDLIELEYAITPQFKTGYASEQDLPLQLNLQLPITTIPAQIPQIASAGIALSPYHRNKKYSASGPRQRYLWIEFTEPVKDNKDTYFARVLAYAPDQLISNNDPAMWAAPDEPALPIDPEYIRVITPNQSIDTAGLNAMQPMQKANDSDKHFLLPLPPGLNSESPEMFGFFTYEIRVGHYKYKGTNQNVWATAQGRFGRALRATGIQHPAPVLLCNVNRDEEKLYVAAPYAQAVYKGKNVTSDPPRTQLWALLYAQVKQADNKDFRNVLLDDRKMDWRTQVAFHASSDAYINLSDQKIEDLKLSAIQNWNPKLTGISNKFHLFPTDETVINKDATKHGTALWQNDEVKELLLMYGLPIDSPLSVLCVEILPTITNIYDHINEFGNEAATSKISASMAAFHPEIKSELNNAATKFSGNELTAMMYIQQPKPLSDQLGQYRILRTSPLTEVPFVCCTTC